MDDRVPVKADAVVRVLFSEIDRLRAVEAAARQYIEADDAYGAAAAAIPMTDGEFPEHGTPEWEPVRLASRARTHAWRALRSATTEPKETPE